MTFVYRSVPTESAVKLNTYYYFVTCCLELIKVTLGLGNMFCPELTITQCGGFQDSKKFFKVIRVSRL